jgi:hypothetical protein
MYAHHPPDVVTLRRLPTGIQTPETDSPLSSTPNSPRDSSAMEGSHFYEAAADLLQELMANKDDNENKQPSPIQNMSLSFQEDEIGMEDNRVPIISVPSEEEPPHLPLKKTEAPFDEAMIILTMDEKKEAEHGDELMGKQPQRTNASFSSSVHTDVDDEGQPPSLAVDRSLTEEIEEPGRINAQWNTDKLMTPSPRRTFSGDQPEDPEEEMAALRMLRTCETTPFGEEEDLLEPGPLNTTATRTPIQQLRSPPNILKQSMAWDTPTMTTGSSNPVVESPTNVVSPSPENAAPEEEDDVPIDETKATETPSVLRPMISPDGKVEGEEEEEDKSNYPMNLGHHHVTSFAKQETTTKSSSLKNEGKTPVVAPFHPQGAVSIDAPEESEGESLVTEKNASYGSAPESAVAAKQPSSVSSLNQLKSTLSDAVDLAASGAAAIVGEMVTGANKAGCGPSSHYHVVNAALESSEAEVYSHFTPPKVGSLARSVTEPMAANDWNKYLKNNDDDEMSTASDGKLNMNVTQWLNTNSKHDQSTKQPGFREMTPKRYFQSSEKTAAWLQEEFKRRYTMKYEINQAILARNDSEGGDDEVEEFIPHSDTMEDGPEIPVEKGFATALSKALEALPTSTGSSPESTKLEVSNHCEDDEVAAITTTDLSASSRSMPPRPGTIQTIHNEEEAAPKPRRLDYGSVRGVQRVPRALSTTSDYTAQTAPGRPYPMPNQFMVTPNGQYQRPTSASHTSYRNEMLRFANETRAALRDKNSEHSMPNSQFRSLAISSSAGEGDGGHSIEVAASFAEEMAKTTRLARPDSATMTEPSLGGSEAAESSDNSHFDISTTPVLVHSMDSHLGIAKGDITLSLLNENTGRLDASKKATWANRVHGAIWRCRRMRRSIGSLGSAPTLQDDRMPGTPARGRTSLPVDTDKGRVAGGVRTVQSTQEAALGHLKHDEIDEALELFEDIIFAYYAYFEKSLKAREANPGMASGGITDFRPYIGVALHNLGILNLLNGEYKEALSYFGRAVDNRKACLGEGHPDHVVGFELSYICSAISRLRRLTHAVS